MSIVKWKHSYAALSFNYILKKGADTAMFFNTRI